jgi:hypothetical protein
MPSGTLSMSRKTESRPKRAARRSKMRPVIASESARLYDIAILDIAQPPAELDNLQTSTTIR